MRKSTLSAECGCRRAILAPLAIGLLLSPASAQQILSEPPEFPTDVPGPSMQLVGDQCTLLATGRIDPGDVDWVQVVLPSASLRTVVDVDFEDGQGSGLLLVAIVGGATVFAMSDSNGEADELCGLGALSDPPGSALDMAADMGATGGGAVLDIGVTGFGDFGFTGGHSQSFTYEVWVFSDSGNAECTSDLDCDDGVLCTVDLCDASTGMCEYTPDGAFCDNGLFCDGVEICDSVSDCLIGISPCGQGETCDEIDGCLTAPLASLDIRPGSCPNPLNRRSNGRLPVALVGSATFDVSLVDPSSLLLMRADGLGGVVAPESKRGRTRYKIKDVSAPTDVGPCTCDARDEHGNDSDHDDSNSEESGDDDSDDHGSKRGRREKQPERYEDGESDGDGIDDMLLKFRTNHVVRQLELRDLAAGETVALTLSGTLMDGTSFSATDCVILVPRTERRRSRSGRRKD